MVMDIERTHLGDRWKGAYLCWQTPADGVPGLKVHDQTTHCDLILNLILPYRKEAIK